MIKIAKNTEPAISPSAMTLKTDQILDHKYCLLHALGQGGFGEV